MTANLPISSARRSPPRWLPLAVVATAMPGMLGASPPIASAPPTRGTISIEQPPGEPIPPDFAEGVAAALAARGFTVLDRPGHSALRAELVVSRTPAGTGAVTVASERGSAAPGGVAGLGGGVTLPLGRNAPRTVRLDRVTLQLTIRRRGADAVLWRGSAVTVRAGDARDTAAALGEGLLRVYPAQPAGLIGVP